jgi:hypothetical protein
MSENMKRRKRSEGVVAMAGDEGAFIRMRCG